MSRSRPYRWTAADYAAAFGIPAVAVFLQICGILADAGLLS